MINFYHEVSIFFEDYELLKGEMVALFVDCLNFLVYHFC